MSDNFDVITHALQEHRAKLWKLTQSNMNADMFNIMDQIRLEQIDTLDKEIAKRNILAGESHHTDKGYQLSTHEKQAEFAKKRCWCHTCRPITIDDMRMVLCPSCGNKRCPRATDHNNECTNSNDPNQVGSIY